MVEAGFGFVFWESNRGEGGEMRKEKLVRSTKQFCSNQVTCIGPRTIEKYWVMKSEWWCQTGWIIFFITQYPSLITHHLKHPTPFGTITHFSSLNIFHTICGLYTCHLVRAKLFCGPHHFLFSHFPSFTPVTLSKHKPEPSFNHNNKNSNNNNNSSNNNNNNNKMQPIRQLIPPPPPPQPATTTSRYRTDNVI